MRVSILQGSTTGTEVYKEIYNPNPQTNVNGLVTIEIGGGIPLTGTFSTIDWSSGPYFLKTETDPAGGTNYTISGTSQLLSVPYALYSKVSETAIDAVKTTGNQTIAGNKTFTGIITVSEPVNPADAATKEYIDNILEAFRITLPKNYAGTVSDIEGNTYRIVTIGSQTWMAENLRTGSYKTGTTIPLVIDNTAWSNTTPGYCWYNNDPSTYKATYGALYNWYAVSTGNLCPIGWRVPTEPDWIILENYLGGSSIAGGKIKETGTEHWTSPNTGADNISGFTALPAGYRDNAGLFTLIFNGTGFLSSSENNGKAINRSPIYFNTILRRFENDKRQGESVRCIKD